MSKFVLLLLICSLFLAVLCSAEEAKPASKPAVDDINTKLQQIMAAVTTNLKPENWQKAWDSTVEDANKAFGNFKSEVEKWAAEKKV